MLEGVEVGMRFETRRAMQARYRKARAIICPVCGEEGTKYPNGRWSCPRDCDDND